MTRIIKEPFVHFLLIGAAVFTASYLLGNSPAESEGELGTRIVITSKIMSALKTRVEKIDRSKPGTTEFKENVQKELELFVQNEILYREGLARKLDENDIEVKYRLIDKMKMMALEQSSLEPLTESEITEFYERNIQLFSKPRRVSIWQAYFDKKKRGEAARTDCETMWQQVQSGGEVSQEMLAAAGDQSYRHPGELQNQVRKQLVHRFGTQVAQELLAVQEPRWLEPVESNTGWHLLRVTQVHSEDTLPLDQVRFHVVSKLKAQRDKRVVDVFYQSLKKKYRVIIN